MVLFLCERAPATVTGPNLPINIKIAIRILPKLDRRCVTPVDKPVVLRAEIVSKSMSNEPICSVKLRRNMDANNMTKDNDMIISALFIVSRGIRFLAMMVSSYPCIDDETEARIIPMVVVLTPPPVELGEAPMNIRSIVRQSVAVLKVFTCPKPKPPVLKDIEQKNELKILFAISIPPRVAGLLNSRRKKLKAPMKMRIADMINTIFVCRDLLMAELFL